MKRDTRTAYRARAAATERSIDDAKAEVKAGEEAERAERIAAYAAKYAPVPFTDEELKAARAIRVGNSFYKVIRVNEKSVTVPSDYSWNYRISIDKVDEVYS